MSFRKFSAIAGLTALLSAAAPYSALAAGPRGDLTTEEIARIRQNYGTSQTNTETDTTPAQPPQLPSSPVPEPAQEQATSAEQTAPPEQAPEPVQEVAPEPAAPRVVAPALQAQAPQVVEQSAVQLPLLPEVTESRSRLLIEAVPRNPQTVEQNNYELHIPLSLSPILRGYSFSGKSVGGFAVGYGGEVGLLLTNNLKLSVAGGVLSRIDHARYAHPSETETTRIVGSEDEYGYADQVLQTDKLRNTDSYDGFAEAAFSYNLGTALIDEEFTLSLGLVAGVLTGQRDLETRTTQLLQTTRNGEPVSSQQTAEAIQSASQGTHLSPTAQARLSLGYAQLGLEASFAAGVFDLSLAHPTKSRDLYTAELKLDLVKIVEGIAE